MPEFTYLQGFTAAVEAAAHLDVAAADSNSEYSRGAIEVIADAFVRVEGGDPDDRKDHVRREIQIARIRAGL